MRTASFVYALLVALAAVNTNQIFGLGWWFAGIVIAVTIVVLVVVFRSPKSDETSYWVLSSIGYLSLFLISVVSVLPALELLQEGSRVMWSSNLIPLFAAAIGFYGLGLWLRANHATKRDALDWLANFLNGPGLLLSLLTACVFTTSTLLLLEWIGQFFEQMQTITRRFLERGIIPPTTVLLFYWGMLILLGKWVNVLLLKNRIRIWQQAGTPSRTSHFDRILSLADDAERLEDRCTHLWRRHEESFTVPRYISWAVPVLGFIGTVLGISLAADGIRELIASESGLSGLSSELGSAIAPLGIAFDTTLIALSLSVVLMLAQTLIQRSEDRSLNTLERHLRETVRVF